MKPLPKSTRLLICAGLGLMAAVGLATNPPGKDEPKAASKPTVQFAERAPLARESRPQSFASTDLSYPQPTTTVSSHHQLPAPTAPSPVAMSAPLMPRVTQQAAVEPPTLSAPIPPTTPAREAPQPTTKPAADSAAEAALKRLQKTNPAAYKAIMAQGIDQPKAPAVAPTAQDDEQAEAPQPTDPPPAPKAAPAPKELPSTPAPPVAVAPPLAPAPLEAVAQPAGPLPPKAEPVLPGKQSEERAKATVTHLPGYDVGDEHLVLNIHDTDLRQVLELLAEQGGLNILASPSVEGKVSASLRDVNVETALDAILKSTGFISRRENKLIFVGTPDEFSKLRSNLDRIGVRVYRLNYVTAKEIQNLVTPLLTPTIGKSTITSAAQTGIAVDAVNAGGDSFASNEAVLVQDYEAVLCQLDQVVREIDRKPMQVAIEAVIVDVTLNDANKWGVNFQFLREQDAVRFGTGTPRVESLNGNGTPDGRGGVTGEFKFTEGGLQFAFLNSSLGAFLTAVENMGEVNVVAHPRLLCMNKQKAEILIGNQIGYVTTTTTQTFATQSVQFLDVGTQLRLRPFISQDGIVRMEVHPEISTGTVSATGVPSKGVTQVTTNIMCPDGSTVVLGGLMQESLQTTTQQVPFLGSTPVIGPLFRTKNESIVRREILVLITPRIICDPEANEEGTVANNQVHRDHEILGDEMTLLSRNYQARLLTRRALAAQEQGRTAYAWRLAQMAVHFNPSDHEATALRDQLEAAMGGRATIRSAGPAPQSPPNAPGPSGTPGGTTTVDGEVLSPWLLDQLEGNPAAMPAPPYPKDPGIPSVIRQVEPVDPLNYARP
jgi:type IV pilus assembly protein PilQ